MGRHSSSGQWPFYRSVLAWFLPWTLLAVGVGTAVFVAIDVIAQGELDTKPPPGTLETTRAPATETPHASPSESPSPRPSPSKKTKKPAKKRQASPKPPALITEDMNLQVLNASANPRADDAIADRLAQLGFRVESIASASRRYERTTVFWSYPQAREAAQRLAARFGWVAQPKPDNLSATVALHVVVGADEA